MASLSWGSGLSSTWSSWVMMATLVPSLKPAFFLASFGMAICPFVLMVAVRIAVIILLVGKVRILFKSCVLASVELIRGKDWWRYLSFSSTCP